MIKRYNENEIDELVKIILNDGVISVPTDTVYGLCARVSSENAYRKLKNVKRRPEEKPFPIMCADLEQIKSIAYVNDLSLAIIDNFMPGPITIILKRQEHLSDYVSNGKDTIAIRMATSEALKCLISKVGEPIFMSSANVSGEEVSKNLDEIEECCPNIDAMLEGNVNFGVSSTIVDCTQDTFKILREGPITEKQITEILNNKE